MEGTEPANSLETTGRHANQESDNMVLMSSKPLHRFVQRDPKSLGIVIVIFGCAEFLMGFHLAAETMHTSYEIYAPLWQGALFIISGSLSIYTVGHPSKKMVTVCFAMYLVSFFGIIFSFGYRISLFSMYHYLLYRLENDSATQRLDQLFGIEGVLFTSSLCVAVLLIFLCCVARLALKSTQTQVIVQCIPPPTGPPESNVTTN